jgi:FMN reductase
VAVTAGLSKPSSTRLLTDRLDEATSARLASAGVPAEVTVIELRDLAVDIANNLVAGFPSASLRDALDAVSRADGLIVVTPVFAGSYSGLFKSFFDLLEPDALTGTPVLLAATGGTARHSLVVEHAMRPLFSYLHALTLPTAVFAATDDWGAGADTYRGGLPARITKAAREFADLLVRMAPTVGVHPPLQRDGSGEAGGTERGTSLSARSGADQGDPYDEDEIVPFEQLLADLN